VSVIERKKTEGKGVKKSTTTPTERLCGGGNERIEDGHKKLTTWQRIEQGRRGGHPG